MSGIKQGQFSQTLKTLTDQGKCFLATGKFSPPALTLVVSLGTEALKIGHGRTTHGDFLIEGVAVEDITKKSDSDIVQSLLLYCQAQKITPTQVLCLISSKQFIFKNVDIPSTEKEEVSKIIDLQAGRFTPYAREEIVIDFVCLEALVQHFTSVLLFIVNRKIADRLAAIFQEARMRIDKVVVACDCMAMVYSSAAKDTPLHGALGGLHIGEEYSELTVIDEHQVVFVRNIPVGASFLKKNPEQAKSDFIQELDRSIGAYHDQGVGKPIHRLLLAGFTETLKSLAEDLKHAGSAHAGKLEVSYFDYRKYFKASESVEGIVQQAAQFSFFELFSVLAHAERTKVNLLLPELKLKRRVHETSRDILGLGILIMAIFLLMSLIMGSKIYFKKVINQKLDGISKKYEEEAKRLEAVSTKNRIVKKLIESRGKELTVLNVINGFIGDDLYLSQINYDSEGHVSVAGTAASMSRVFAFVTQLMQSNYFSKVETKETKSRKEGKQDVADFLIECTLAKGF
jgi:Tfp pilus assembly PilM family ATPase/Tfp pilus assembly protein PilN